VDAAENARLARLVEIGYRIYRGEITVPDQPAPVAKDPIKGWSEEAYREGLQREIEESFSASPGTLEYLISQVGREPLSGFTERDCVAAVEILDAFLGTALFVESASGDGPQAVKELQAEVPGLPGHLYASVLGYYAYMNR
jgi:hypothetical protein